VCIVCRPAIFRHNYHPRIYRYGEEATMLQMGESELDFKDPGGAFNIWWQGGRRNLTVCAKPHLFCRGVRGGSKTYEAMQI